MRNLPRAAGSGCLWFFLNVLFLIFIGIGGFFGYRSFRLIQTGGTVTGTVVDIRVSSDDNGDSYAPVVEYTVSGDRYQMTGTYTNPRAFDVGDRVKVRFDRADPSVAVIDSFVDLWLLPLIFIPLGLLFGVLYNLSMLFSWLRRRRVG